MNTMYTRDICLILTVVLFSGCASVQKDWERAQSINQPKAYKEFIAKYPKDAHYRPLALQRLETVEYEETSQIGTIEAYQRFIEKYPQGRLSEMAETKLESLYFQRAKDVGNIEVYEDFLKRYPKERFVEMAQTKLETLYFQKAKDVGTIEAYEDFLKRYPKGTLAVQAKLWLEEDAYKKAMLFRNFDDRYYFLANYPSSKYYDKLYERLYEELVFDEGGGTVKELKEFLSKFPSSKFGDNVRLKMEIEIARDKIQKALKSVAGKDSYMEYGTFSSWLSDSRANLQTIQRAGPTDERGSYTGIVRWYYFYLYDIDPNMSIKEVKYVSEVPYYNVEIYAKEGKKSFEFSNPPNDYVTSKMSFYFPEKKAAEDFVSGLKTLVELTPEWNKTRTKKRVKTD
jgi:hypothetical protein